MTKQHRPWGFLHSDCFLLLQIVLWVCMKKSISHIFHIPMVIQHCCFPKFQILYVLLLQENTCPHILHFQGFSSVYILLAENKFEYNSMLFREYRIVSIPCIYMVSFFYFLHIATTDSLCSSFARKYLPAFLTFVRFLFIMDSSCRKQIWISLGDCAILAFIWFFFGVNFFPSFYHSWNSSYKLHFQEDLVIIKIDSFVLSKATTRSSTCLAFLWLISFNDSSESIQNFF